MIDRPPGRTRPPSAPRVPRLDPEHTVAETAWNPNRQPHVSFGVIRKEKSEYQSCRNRSDAAGRKRRFSEWANGTNWPGGNGYHEPGPRLWRGNDGPTNPRGQVQSPDWV